MLRLPPVVVNRPGSLREALSALASQPRARVLAGGTDLLVSLKQGHGAPAAEALHLVSLADLPLSGIEETRDGCRLGAGSTLWDLARWRTSTALDVVAEAARQIAAPPIRSRATLGGNLCLDTRCFFYNQSAFWRSGRPPCYKAGGGVCHVAPAGDRCHACHQSDLAPVMVALGATARLESADGAREALVEDLYTGRGDKPLAVAASELLTSVTLPPLPPKAGAGWEKLRVRKGLDFAAASAAVYLEVGPDGACRDVRVALGALGTKPLRVPESEQALRGTKLEPEAVGAAAQAAQRAARPMKNTDLTPAYRRQVAGVAVARAAKKAWEQAREG